MHDDGGYRASLVWFGLAGFLLASLVSAGLAWLVFGQVEFGIFAVTRGYKPDLVWFGFLL